MKSPKDWYRSSREGGALGGLNSVLRQFRGSALDPKNKSVIVSDKYVNAVMTFYFPETF